MSNFNNNFQVDFTWIIVLGLVFLLGTGRETQKGGEEPIVIP